MKLKSFALLKRWITVGCSGIPEIEQERAITCEPVGEEHAGRTKLVLRVVRKETLLTHRHGRDHATVLTIRRLQIEYRQELAVLAIHVSRPHEQVAAAALHRAR